MSLLPIGVALVVLGLMGLARSVLLLSRGVRVTGTIVRIDVSDPDGEAMYYPVVRYRTPDGTEQELKLTGVSTPEYHRVDRTVPLLYLPSSPTGVTDSSFKGLWLWPGVLLLFGLVFLAAGLFEEERP